MLIKWPCCCFGEPTVLVCGDGGSRATATHPQQQEAGAPGDDARLENQLQPGPAAAQEPQSRQSAAAACSDACWGGRDALQPGQQRSTPVEPLHDRYFVPYTELVFHELIGRGSFKSCYRGKWGGTSVAIARMRRGGMLCEARLMQRLSRHPNLVQFYRWSLDSLGNEYVVMELVALGSLDKLLGQWGELLRTRAKLSIAEQVCAAMAELAREGVLHGDLAARNVLVQSVDPVHVKVADFGLARRAQPRPGDCPATPGSVAARWMAPEVLAGGPAVGEASDVWSFAVLVFEIFSNGAEPYVELSDEEVPHAVRAGARLPRPARCPREVWQLMLGCWATDPAERPTFDGIVNMFRAWRRQHQAEAATQPPWSAPAAAPLVFPTGSVSSRSLVLSRIGGSIPEAQLRYATSCGPQFAAVAAAVAAATAAAEEPPSCSGAALSQPAQRGASAPLPVVDLNSQVVAQLLSKGLLLPAEQWAGGGRAPSCASQPSASSLARTPDAAAQAARARWLGSLATVGDPSAEGPGGDGPHSLPRHPSSAYSSGSGPADGAAPGGSAVPQAKEASLVPPPQLPPQAGGVAGGATLARPASAAKHVAFGDLPPAQWVGSPPSRVPPDEHQPEWSAHSGRSHGSAASAWSFPSTAIGGCCEEDEECGGSSIGMSFEWEGEIDPNRLDRASEVHSAEHGAPLQSPAAGGGGGRLANASCQPLRAAAGGASPAGADAGALLSASHSASGPATPTAGGWGTAGPCLLEAPAGHVARIGEAPEYSELHGKFPAGTTTLRARLLAPAVAGAPAAAAAPWAPGCAPPLAARGPSSIAGSEASAGGSSGGGSSSAPPGGAAHAPVELPPSSLAPARAGRRSPYVHVRAAVLGAPPPAAAVRDL